MSSRFGCKLNASLAYPCQNGTSMEAEDLKEKIQKISKLVTIFYLPIVVTIGLIGNTLTLIILSSESKLAKCFNQNDSFIQNFRNMNSNYNLQSRVKSSNMSIDAKLHCRQQLLSQKFTNYLPKKHHSQFLSTNYFIFALAVSDLAWNFILLLVWITEAGLYNVVNNNYICQVSIVISYVCSFLSAAFTLLFTFQRFLAVVKPLKSATGSTLQSTHFIRRLIIGLIAFAFLIYSFSIFLYDMTPKKDHELAEAVAKCGVNANYIKAVDIFDNTVDPFLTLVIPSLGIIAMNGLIVRTFSKYQKEYNLVAHSKVSCKKEKPYEFIKNKSKRSLMLPNEEISLEIVHEKNSSARSSQIIGIKSRSRLDLTLTTMPKSNQINSSSHITKTLLMVSFSFILLNSPYRASRLIAYIRMTLTENFVLTNLEYAVSEVLINFYFTSYSVNFFLYSLCGKKFRASFQALMLYCLFYLYSSSRKLFGAIFKQK